MTIDDPTTLESLIGRLRALRPDAERRWGTLTAGEMLCHLADGHQWVLAQPASSEGASKIRSRPILKWVALYSPLPWSKRAQTHPSADPKREGTRPGDFEADRERAIESLRKIAEAPAAELSPVHELFGPMSARDWYRSVYRHVNHHLCQFGM